MAVYKSCKWIEHGFVFDKKNELRTCPFFNGNKGGRPILCEDYQGQNIDWDIIFKIKNKQKEKFKNNTSPQTCENCVYIQEKNWDEENYIDELLFSHWSKCNAGCVFCTVKNSNAEDKTIYYNVVPAIKDAIIRGIIKKDALITFSGGECTIYPEFEELLRLFTSNQFTNIVINSSGIKFSREIEMALSKGLCHLIVSVDAGSKDIFYNLKGVNAYYMLWCNLQKYSMAQYNSNNSNLVTAKYVLLAEINNTKKELKEFFNNVKKFKITSVALNIDLNVPQSAYNMEELITLTEFFISTAKKQKLHITLYPGIQSIFKKANTNVKN